MKVIRVLTYECPKQAESLLRRTLRDSALSGKTFGKIVLTSVTVLAEEAPCLACEGNTNNTSLICDKCQAAAARIAEQGE